MCVCVCMCVCVSVCVCTKESKAEALQPRSVVHVTDHRTVVGFV
jgi:hypothetical protein